ncbi:MAG TPA: hypothetical protein VGO62_06450 [Myxococcota bacterium]
MDAFWPFFASDDGSLPEISIELASLELVRRLYFEIRARSTLVGIEPLRIFEFHHCVKLFRPRDLPLPALGVRVDPSALRVDYRMGEWKREQVAELIAWLVDVDQRYHPRTIALDRDVSPAWTAAFHAAFTTTKNA